MLISLSRRKVFFLLSLLLLSTSAYSGLTMPLCPTCHYLCFLMCFSSGQLYRWQAVGGKERIFFDNIRGGLCLVSVSSQKGLTIGNVRLCTESSILKHSWLLCGLVNM